MATNLINNLMGSMESVIQKLRFNTNDENSIDLQKTFDVSNIDITPLIKLLLDLDATFPDNIINSNAGNKYHELEFFKTNLDSDNTQNLESIFQKINKTQTLLGSYLLQSILLKPLHNTTDINTILSNRQQIIKDILDSNILQTPNTVQINVIRNEISKLAEIEKEVVVLFNMDTPEMKEVYNVIFFEMKPLQFLNYQEVFLKIFNYFIIIFNPLYGMIAPFIFVFVPFLFMKHILKIPITFDVFWQIIKKMMIGGTGFFTNINKILNSPIGTAVASNLTGSTDSNHFTLKGIILWLAKLFIGFMASSAGTYIYVAFICVSYIYGIYNNIQVSLTYNKIINMFHSRMNILAKWLRQCIHFLNNSICTQSIEIVAIIKQIHNIMTHPTLQNLISHSVFAMDPGVISNKGMIIKTFREFLDMKEQMQLFIKPFCQYVAYIDVFYSISHWVNDITLETPKSYCQYITDTNQPQVIGNQVWNICCSNPICNDINLGKITNESTMPLEISTSNINISDISETSNTNATFSNMLITGANGSGKSTFIKSVIECIILGQTIGVVPAQEFKFTPFAKITTYLNIPDCQGKESLFQAEMNRCHNQIEMLEQAERDNEFSFNIMDEIFVSTNYLEGMSGAFAIIKQLNNFTKALNIITTHYDVLANMEDLQVDKKYFDIMVNTDSDDIIIKDYKIKSGVSKKHFALKLLKQKGFNANIIKDAEYFYNKIKNDQLVAKLTNNKIKLENEKKIEKNNEKLDDQ